MKQILDSKWFNAILLASNAFCLFDWIWLSPQAGKAALGASVATVAFIKLLRPAR